MPIATIDQPALQHIPSASQQLAASKVDVVAKTRHGDIHGGRLTNGVQAFLSESEGHTTTDVRLDVPYGEDVPRWSDPMPLSDDYRYAPEPYTRGQAYCAQNHEHPQDGGKLAAVRSHDGWLDTGPLGEATENPFFLDIYVPSTCNLKEHSASLPVNVYIHGGALQHGSTFGNGHDQQWVSSERFQEIRVNVAYR
jgi:carboxylesterase type B